MTGDSNLGHLSRAIEAWNRGDLDAYLDLYDDGITLHGYSPQPMDKSTVRGFYSMVFGAFPGSQLTIDEEIVDGGCGSPSAARTTACSWGSRLPVPASRCPGRRCCTSETGG